MLYKIKVRPESKKQQVVKKKNYEFLVCLKSKAEKGMANKELIGLLSDFFGVSVSKIKIKRGLKTTNKILEIK
ncbi:MAG: DUF167 domain-containing protein [bacterium]|nr:DUF167 domain-containing protein [bacterium]